MSWKFLDLVLVAVGFISLLVLAFTSYLSFLTGWVGHGSRFVLGFIAAFGILYPFRIYLLRLISKRGYHKYRGLCEKCGYDVRESPDRCPECGNTVDR